MAGCSTPHPDLKWEKEDQKKMVTLEDFDILVSTPLNQTEAKAFVYGNEEEDWRVYTYQEAGDPFDHKYIVTMIRKKEFEEE